MNQQLSPESAPVPTITGTGRGRLANLRGLPFDGARSLTLLLILVAVWLTFQVLTDGLFLTPRNLTLLSVQVAVTAVLAAGIVMVMVPGHIDLSIGAAVAITAIVTAMTMRDLGVSTPVAILLTLLAGGLIGAWHGLWVAYLGVPSFIVTLASLMALRGLALLVTKGETSSPGTGVTSIASTYVPGGWTLLIFALLVAGFVALQIRELRARRAARMSTSAVRIVVVPAVVLGAICAGAAGVALSYKGLPVPVLILLVLAIAVAALLRLTRVGRQLYAMGGNPEAARLAGIRTKRHTFWIFTAMGVLYGVAGLILVARLGSAPPNAASGLELNVIAAAVIGGTSLLGGIGTVAGALMGAVLMESLNNGMSLMNLPTYWQQISVGLVLLVAVYIDLRSRRGRV